jgi:hypothetical protein
MSNDHSCKKRKHSEKECECKKKHSEKECECRKNRCKDIRIINLWKPNRD